MQQPVSAKIYRNKTTRLTKQAGFFYTFAVALILPPIEFILKRVGFFLYRCYFVTNSKYAGEGLTRTGWNPGRERSEQTLGILRRKIILWQFFAENLN